MRVIIFGATGMVGQGVLRECVLADDVGSVLVVGRQRTGVRHPKLHEVQHTDFTDFSALAGEFAGADACFWCLGVSSAGMREAAYTRVTYDYTVAAVRTLETINPDLTFVYVSGAGTDSTEHGRLMWARVKGRTENAVLAAFPNGYAFRPGFIIPRHGARSRTTWYRLLYAVATPLVPLLTRVSPGAVTSTDQVGRAMLGVARAGCPKRVLSNRDLATL